MLRTSDSIIEHLGPLSVFISYLTLTSDEASAGCVEVQAESSVHILLFDCPGGFNTEPAFSSSEHFAGLFIALQSP